MTELAQPATIVLLPVKIRQLPEALNVWLVESTVMEVRASQLERKPLDVPIMFAGINKEVIWLQLEKASAPIISTELSAGILVLSQAQTRVAELLLTIQLPFEKKVVLSLETVNEVKDGQL